MRKGLVFLIAALALCMSACSGAGAQDSPLGNRRDSAEQCAAYENILTTLIEERGVCTSHTDGSGLAYAELLDFNADGILEMYLYFIEDAPNAAETGADTAAARCAHEQLWSWNGSEAVLSFEDLQYSDRQNGDGRVLYSDDGATYLASRVDTRSQTQVQGVLVLYSFDGEDVTEHLKVTDTYYSANIITSGSGGWYVKKQYGITSRDADTLYFSSGTVVRNGAEDAAGKYNTDNCLATYKYMAGEREIRFSRDKENPVALIMDFDSAETRHELIYGDRVNNSLRYSWDLTWELSDVRALRDELLAGAES